MGIRYNWDKSTFSNTYKIYLATKPIGIIRRRIFSLNATSEINNKKYSFRQKSFLKKEAEIFNSQNQVIGTIQYRFWGNKAIIKTEKGSFVWQYTNIRNSRWEIQNGNNFRIRYSNIDNSIESDINDDLQVLIGLHLFNYNRQGAIIMMIVLFILLFLVIR